MSEHHEQEISVDSGSGESSGQAGGNDAGSVAHNDSDPTPSEMPEIVIASESLLPDGVAKCGGLLGVEAKSVGFSPNLQTVGHPTVDLFASRTSHQLDNYMSFKMDPGATATDAFQQPWENMLPYAFPPFSLVGRVLKKVNNHQCDMILVAPVWPCQPWYPLLLEMCTETPLLILQKQNLLQNPKGEFHPLLRRGGRGLQLAAWKISGDVCKQRVFQMKQSNSFATGEGKVHSMVTTAAGRNSLAGLWKEKLIQFDATWLSS
jgi:hypothetical protein